MHWNGLTKTFTGKNLRVVANSVREMSVTDADSAHHSPTIHHLVFQQVLSNGSLTHALDHG